MGGLEARRGRFGESDGGMRTLPDGSYSWSQPDSRGIGGWEGYCGQTAVANLLTTYGPQCVSPVAVSRAAGDPGPGSHPATLMRALERFRPGAFALRVGEGLDRAAPRRPIATLLRWDGTTFHWVTVVRSTTSKVTFNHWGRQQELLRTEFERRWSFGGLIAAGAAYAVGSILPHTSIRPAR